MIGSINNDLVEEYNGLDWGDDCINMYKYFISFSYLTEEGLAFGNSVLNSTIRITDYDDVHEMNNWIKDMQQYISEIGNVKNVSILNFQIIK